MLITGFRWGSLKSIDTIEDVKPGRNVPNTNPRRVPVRDVVNAYPSIDTFTILLGAPIEASVCRTSSDSMSELYP